jgi:cysteine desulfurase
MPLRCDCNGAPGSADTGIDNYHVHGSIGKIAIRTIDDQSSSENVVSADIVSDVDDVNSRRDAQDHPFNDSNEGIGKAKVRGERYNHSMRRVYLDSNATTPMRPEVVAAMVPVFTEQFGNASSIHWFGQDAKSLIDDARREVAKLINAETSEIVFVSGGTEADNFAVRGTKRGHIITSKIEHHAVMHTCKDLEKQGYDVTWIGVSADGVVDPDDVRNAIRPETVLISIMHANNEIGTIQPIEEIGKIAAEADVYFHSDGVQSTGKIPVDVKKLGVDLYSISAHKIHGPKGVGALFIKKGTTLKPIMTGGGHERNRRSGTENVPGIVGFGAAARLAREGLSHDMARVQFLRDRLETELKRQVELIHINGENAKRLPNTSNIMVDYAEGEGLVISLDLKGVAVSTGSACSSGSLEPSHVLTAIGKTPDEAHGSLRFSLSSMTSAEDIDYVLNLMPGVVSRLRELSPYYKRV